MKLERILIKGCCNKTKVVFKIDRPVTQALIDILKSNGFTENPGFTKAGMLYVYNPDLIVSGPIGADRVNIACKKEDCEKILNDFEALLIKME